MFTGTLVSSNDQSSVYSVSTLNLAIRDHIEDRFFYCLVEGEISNAAFPQSGHIYFNLKDDGAVIKAVIWRSQAMLYRALVLSGQKVRVTGKVTVYAPRGEYQLIVSRIEEAGKGDLHLKFEVLKRQLQAEGLFDPTNKKAIPQHPRKIGVITSKSAAALQDVLNVFSQHRPDIPLILYETKVQGENAGKEIALAIEEANEKAECDLLLLVRGGGSIEDLWAFNEEVVARAIFTSEIPIITGVGHETDTTIADFVSDLRAPTPSMAAKYSSQSRDELFQLLNDFEGLLINLMERRVAKEWLELTSLIHRLRVKEPKLQIMQSQGQLSALRERLRENLMTRLSYQHFLLQSLESRLGAKLIYNRLAICQQQVVELSQRLENAMSNQQKKVRERLLSQVEKLHMLSPLTTLLRGYSMTTNEQGEVVKSIEQVSKNDLLKIQVSNGVIMTKVTTTKLL